MIINPFFPEIKGNFGFGCMRLPMAEGAVNLKEMERMADAFFQAGFNYIDTAHGYLGGQSETAIRETIVKRYPRERFLLTNKLTNNYFQTEADIRPLFEEQLQACGVDYFDFYLMHAQSGSNYGHYQDCRAYETAFALKEEGKIRHVGLSFHDKPEVLDQILTDHPQIEIVQIQLNYIDYEDPSVESRKVYEVCEKHQKPVIVMEPVKGGILANLPAEAGAVFDRLSGQECPVSKEAGKAADTKPSYASYAIRFAASFPCICMVLSGMSDLAQMQDNLHFMTEFQPLSQAEFAAIDEIREVLSSMVRIPCTACKYCILDNKCPKEINIPEIFSCYNAKLIYNNPQQNFIYKNFITKEGSRASDCLKCGKCEKICPQHLPIRDYLAEAAASLEN